MRTIGSYEAKTHLARLLDEVGRGATITITKHGLPIAMLVPAPSAQQPDPAQVIEALRNFRKDITLSGLSVREMIEEGRH
ncbi:MAG: type II toxin-antitoxin system prevent-host-death family antitoxin [Deinococcota bacterium]|jgi:prevent-host-death family protein|nr:type II toxin-antitoxin system prevent-host-death family antitoxin [Deinococcota bacterium]